MSKNKLPKHIKDIYVHALKLKCPLQKMIHCGEDNRYNYGKYRAATFVGYYFIENKKDRKGNQQ